MQSLRPLLTIAPLAALLALAVSCGSDSGSAPSPSVAPAGLNVEKAERVFITRPFGVSLPAVLLYLEFDGPPPTSPVYEATGSDGEVYKGVFPGESKICGFPAYLGIGPDAGREGNKRTIAFIVPDAVTLTELEWRASTETPAQSLALPEETLVCTPPVGSSAAPAGSRMPRV